MRSRGSVPHCEAGPAAAQSTGTIDKEAEAVENLQKSVDIGATLAMGGAFSSDPSHAGWAAWEDLLVEYRGGWVPLPCAAKKGYDAVVRQLLEKGGRRYRIRRYASY